jgi:hypothetical protein
MAVSFRRVADVEPDGPWIVAAVEPASRDAYCGRMRAAVIAAVAIALGAALSACSPGAPKGVSKDKLDDAVGGAIGDPATCVQIAEPSGRVVYQFNNHIACGRSLPACGKPGATQTVAQLLKAVAADHQPRMASCTWPNDPSRGISWAAGPIPGKDLTYAALMEGQRALPGRMMAERLEDAFKTSGVEPK